MMVTDTMAIDIEKEVTDRDLSLSVALSTAMIMTKETRTSKTDRVTAGASPALVTRERPI